MSKMRSMTALTLVFLATLLVAPDDHVVAAARTGLRVPTPPSGAARDMPTRLSSLYHIGVVIVSAAIAATLPFTFAFLARRLLASWSAIENEKVFLVSAEIAVALVLVLVLNHARTNWRNRRVSKMAHAAGVIHLRSANGVPSRRGARRPKERHALIRGMLLI